MSKRTRCGKNQKRKNKYEEIVKKTEKNEVAKMKCVPLSNYQENGWFLNISFWLFRFVFNLKQCRISLGDVLFLYYCKARYFHVRYVSSVSFSATLRWEREYGFG